MISLSLKNGGAFLGTIEDADLQLLVDQLEEEDSKDTDYYIDAATIEFLAQAGASQELIRILKAAVGESEGVEIVWSKA